MTPTPIDQFAAGGIPAEAILKQATVPTAPRSLSPRWTWRHIAVLTVSAHSLISVIIWSLPDTQPAPWGIALMFTLWAVVALAVMPWPIVLAVTRDEAVRIWHRRARFDAACLAELDSIVDAGVAAGRRVAREAGKPDDLDVMWAPFTEHVMAESQRVRRRYGPAAVERLHTKMLVQAYALERDAAEARIEAHARTVGERWDTYHAAVTTASASILMGDDPADVRNVDDVPRPLLDLRMGSGARGPEALLLSVRQPFIDRILAGTKTTEIRKTKPRDTASVIVLYASAPVKAVVAIAHLRTVNQRDPRDILDLPLTNPETGAPDGGLGVTLAELRDYVHREGAGGIVDVVYLLRLAEVYVLPYPLPLSAIDPTMKAGPQGYRYLTDPQRLALADAIDDTRWADAWQAQRQEKSND